MKIEKLLLLSVSIALVAASCTSSTQVTTTDPVPGPTTTQVSSTTTTQVADTTVPGDDGPDPAVVAALKAQIEELIDITEDLRGLEFIRRPEVVVLTVEQTAARVREDIEEELDPVSLAVDDRMFRLLGMMGPDDSLAEIYPELYAEQVAGFYDGDTQELVIAGDSDELSPLTKSVVVHELIHALTDQYFSFHDQMVELSDADGRSEDVAALQALVEGDATYFQFLYLQQLSVLEQVAMLAEAQQVPTDVLDSAPEFLAESLGFPYTTGMIFVQNLIDLGGSVALDTAYGAVPTTTEQIIHPERYRTGEGASTVEHAQVTLDGWELQITDTLGEWGLNLLLLGSISRGNRVVVTNGWGGDSYSVYYTDDQIAFVFRYVGDSEDDATEVTQALIDHTRDTLALGEGISDGAGRVWEVDGRYAFIDRVGDGLVYILSTDIDAGRSIRSQVSVP